MNLVNSLCSFFCPQGTPETGSVGSKRFADNLRILFVNGIGTSHDECRNKCRSISQIFGDSRVDYAYLPLTIPDVVNALNPESKSNSQLLKKIQTLLAELKPWSQPHTEQKTNNYLMGGPRLLIIAHSGGGAEIKTLMKELPAQNRDLIDIVSLGSAHLFRPKEGWRKTDNFVARTDPIPFICSCIAGNLRSLIHQATHYIGREQESIGEAHGFLNPTYQRALQRIASTYKKEHAKTLNIR